MGIFNRDKKKEKDSWEIEFEKNYKKGQDPFIYKMRCLCGMTWDSDPLKEELHCPQCKALWKNKRYRPTWKPNPELYKYRM